LSKSSQIKSNQIEPWSRLLIYIIIIIPCAAALAIYRHQSQSAQNKNEKISNINIYLNIFKLKKKKLIDDDVTAMTRKRFVDTLCNGYCMT